MDQLEDMICEDTDRTQMIKIFRLLCIQSLTSGGIRTNKLDSIRRLIAQTYGYEHLFTMLNLEKAGTLLISQLYSQWYDAKSINTKY